MSAVMKNHQHADMWTLVPLKEIGLWSGGGTPSKAKPEFWADGTIPWVSPKDMKTDRIADSEDHITHAAIEGSTTKLIPAGSVLIVTRSGILSHTLPIAVTAVPVTVNQDLKAITPRDGVSPDYVAWAIRCFAREILNTCSKQGTTVSSIETAALQRFEIPLPALDQQKRIVAEIEKQFSRLDEAVAGLKRVKANLKRYKAAVLKTAVEGRLVETEAELARREGRSYETGEQLLQRILETRRSQWQGKGKYKEPTAPDTTGLPELPEGWSWTTLEAIAEVIDPNPSHRMPKYVDTGVPFVSSENFIGEEAIDFTIGKQVTTETLKQQREKFSIESGDFVLSRIGTIGKTRFLPIGRNYCLSHALVVIKVFSDLIHKEWLRRTISSDSVLSQAREGVQSVGVPDLGMAKIRSFNVPLPPTGEQGRIAEEVDRRLSLLRETEAQVDANLQRAERLRQSILTQSFSGRLPAPRIDFDTRN